MSGFMERHRDSVPSDAQLVREAGKKIHASLSSLENFIEDLRGIRHLDWWWLGGGVCSALPLQR